MLFYGDHLPSLPDAFADLGFDDGGTANSQPTRYLCPDCGEPMHLGDGDWMICETGAHAHPGPRRLEREYRRKPPVSTQTVCALARITPDSLWQWHKRGKIQPTNPGSKPLLWLPWDVMTCRYPDIAAAINTRDTLAS